MNSWIKINSKLHAVFAAILLCVMTFFGGWWINPQHIPHNFGGVLHALDFGLFFIISYIIWHPLLMEVLTWSIASHIKKTPKRTPQKGLRVAFITTFVPASESISLLHKTLPAMLRANYAHDTWLLDEGNDEAARKLCKRLGVKHFSRYGHDHYNTTEGKFAKKTKGGNHNAWYDAHGDKYDVVAQIDTDFIPRKTFLQKTLGYFRDPTVAFVGTPQVYGNMHSVIARGAAQQTYSFYGPILRGMAGMDTTMLIGANHIIRVSALKNVDHYSAHITEDLLTGMKLHAEGWKSVYVPEALAIGEGPTTWKAYFAQQKRWAYGCMHILFKHSFRLVRSMSGRRALYYLLIQQHYFMGLAMGLSVVCLSLYFGFGITTANIPFVSFMGLYTVTLGLCLGMSLSMQRFNIRPKKERGLMFASAYLNLAAWPVFLMAFFQLFKRKKLVFKVTPKGNAANSKRRTTTPLRLFVPHLTIACISLAGLASSVFTHRNAPLMLFWSTLTTVTMLIPPVFVPAAMAVIHKIQLLKKKRIFALQYRWLARG